MMKSVALHNLGCKVNSYELDVIGQKLKEKGFSIVPFDEKADIYIVNTCSVTNIADRKSRQMLHQAKKRNPEAVVVAVGCYVQTGGEQMLADAAVDLLIGNNRKRDTAEILEEYLKNRETAGRSQKNKKDEEQGDKAGEAAEPTAGRFPGEKAEPAADKLPGRELEPKTDKTLGGRTVVDIGRETAYEEMQLTHTAEHTRAYIKIQDGCNQFCSYCAIPYARGRVRSRRMEDILEEVQGLVRAGYREVVLTGIHISSYGIDFEESPQEAGGQPRYDGHSRLTELVERIHEVSGLERIRLGSLEPRIITPETVGRLAALPKLCPHFHLSLQSGCDATLKRMNRHYTTGEYYKSVELLRQRFDEPAITTDVIVGFPGETEEEFARTREFLEKVCFYEMHVFKYSRRAGTAADSMPDQIPEPVKARRSAELIAMRERQSREFRRRYIGKEAEVLLEETRGIGGRTYCIGHTKDYVKVAVDVTGRAQGDIPAINTLAKVRVRDFLTEEILM